ncbi:MAG: toll/interleukin-1 receptor domain-containing protein [Chloroflexota bacterium]|nr:toll/interleukin-1 receptor domain-containing protein [Chloroflexota bacterium]
MTTIYLSYSHNADRNWVTAFGEAINQHGHNAWTGERIIKPGGGWIEAFETGIQNSTIIVMILSGEHESQPEVFFELGYAKALQKRCVFISPDGISVPWIPDELHIGMTIPLTSPQETAATLISSL